MKLRSNLLIGMALMSLPMFSANGIGPAETTGKIIREQIVLNDVNVQSGEKVELLFTTNEKGEVNFVLAKTDNLKLRQAVEKKFSSLRFDGLKQDLVYGLTLKIKTL